MDYRMCIASETAAGRRRLRLPRRVGRRVTGGLVLVALAATGCGGKAAEKVASPQSRVTAKEKALAAAQTTFDAASAAFCADSKDYIGAVDRYGNIFDQAAVTVGDVKTAGADLAKPRAAILYFGGMAAVGGAV